MGPKRYFSYWDILLYFFIFVFLFFLLYKTSSKASAELFVKINSPTKEYRYSLSDYGTYFIEGLLGTTSITINKEGVMVSDSCCPHKDCMSGKALTQPYQYKACLPNGIVVVIMPRKVKKSDNLKERIDVLSY